MIGYLDLILRLAIWFLLTADVSLPNIIIGVCVALLLPRGYTAPTVLKDWLRVIGEIIIAIPQAYFEAFEIMFRPHNSRRYCDGKGQTTAHTWTDLSRYFSDYFYPKNYCFEISRRWLV